SIYLSLAVLHSPPSLFPYTTLFRSPSLGINVQNVFGIQRSIGPASPTFNISGWTQYGLNSNTLRSQIDNNFQPSVSATKVWKLLDRKSTRLNSSHQIISYAVFCLKK